MAAWASGAFAPNAFAGTAWATSTVAVAPVITTLTLPNGQEGVPYSQQLAATGTGPIVWSLDSPVPIGWSINASTGVVSRASPTPGNVTLLVRASNSTLPNATRTLAFQIVEADEFQAAPPPARVWRVTGSDTGLRSPAIRRRMDGLAWVEMAVGDETDHGLDYADVLKVSETIVSSDWVIPIGLAAGPEGVEGTISTQWLTASTAGTYACRNSILTSDGRRYTRTLMVAVLASVS